MFFFGHSCLYVISTFLSILVLIIVRINAQYNTVSSSFVRPTKHIAKVVDKTCLLKPQYGPCRANVEMYYFNPAGMNCSIFRWGGCQGNGNRFDTISECETTCLGSSASKRRPKFCSLSFDYGFCFGAVFRYYYDPLWKVCKKRIFSGCGGNKNNFYSFEQCESICRFGNGELTVDDGDKKNKKKVLIINPWQHTKTTAPPTKNDTLKGPTTCVPQTIPTTTADPEDCFRRKNNKVTE